MSETNPVLRSIKFPRILPNLLAVFLVFTLIGWALLKYCGLAVIFFLMKECTLMTEHQPSDREVIKIFETNRAAFEQLRLMALEDEARWRVIEIDTQGKSRTDLAWTSDLSIRRQREYVSLLSSIRPVPSVCAIRDHSVAFSLSSGGLGPLGVDWKKGVRYIPGNPEKEGLILNDLDKAKKGDGDELLRQIEEHWFVYYESY